ncbi:protein MIZU-KUSSEI 1 [Solanum lycopersicum]|uniref:protein MIZU-KUSSEI 1 n=1 Tax=Solanum lycopersicum TaxID=4081 RepID=UPI000532EAEE
MPSPKTLPSKPRNVVAPDSSSPRLPPTPVLLQQPSHKKGQWKSTKLFRRVKSVFRSFPVINPPCKMPVSNRLHEGHIHGGKQMTGKLLQDMGSGLVRIALECEKNHSEKLKLIDEPIWTMYCNGRKVGYAVKRGPTEDDLKVMQNLHAVSMGAGVLPSESSEGELTYMRAFFERTVGSKDSETYYMMNPNGTSGPELSIFFVRI